jgi:hypothetical protein
MLSSREGSATTAQSVCPASLQYPESGPELLSFGHDYFCRTENGRNMPTPTTKGAVFSPKPPSNAAKVDDLFEETLAAQTIRKAAQPLRANHFEQVPRGKFQGDTHPMALADVR